MPEEPATYEDVRRYQDEMSACFAAELWKTKRSFRQVDLEEEIVLRRKLLAFNQKYHAMGSSKVRKPDVSKWKRLRTALVSYLLRV